jgi:hypothetical protein
MSQTLDLALARHRQTNAKLTRRAIRVTVCVGLDIQRIDGIEMLETKDNQLHRGKKSNHLNNSQPGARTQKFTCARAPMRSTWHSAIRKINMWQLNWIRSVLSTEGSRVHVRIGKTCNRQHESGTWISFQGAHEQMRTRGCTWKSRVSLTMLPVSDQYAVTYVVRIVVLEM